MHRVVSARVWVILALVFLSGWGESSAEARHCRGRRQRCCCPAPSKTCCPAPCESCCCGTRDAARICCIEEVYSAPGFYLYYVHHHENGEECPEYSVEFFHTDHDRHPPEICYEDCDEFSRVNNSLVGLDHAIDATDDLSGIATARNSTKLDEVAGNIILPDGRKIHARIGVFKVKAPVTVDGVEKEVTEYFGFGLESADTGRDEIHAPHVKEHLIGSVPQNNLYEFNIGTLKCVVLTVK